MALLISKTTTRGNQHNDAGFLDTVSVTLQAGVNLDGVLKHVTNQFEGPLVKKSTVSIRRWSWAYQGNRISEFDGSKLLKRIADARECTDQDLLLGWQ